MEQEVREILEETVADRAAVLKRVEALWSQQTRRPSAEEIDRWIESGQE